MDQNALIMLLVGITITSALFAVGVLPYPKLKSKEQGYPFEAAIASALLPLLFEGLCAACRLSEKGVDDIHTRIRGVAKKKIANSMHRMLPEKIGHFELALVKRVVTQERFETLVQNAFDDSDRLFVEHQMHFDDLFEQWKMVSKPV